MEAEKIPENKGIEPEQKQALESMLTDFEPEKDVGQEPIESEPEISTGEMCATCLGVVFGIVAGRRGEHWNLSAEEAEQLGNATGAVLDKYVPDIQGGVEYTLIVAAGMVVIPRLMVDKKLQEAATDGDKSEAGSAE